MQHVAEGLSLVWLRTRVSLKNGPLLIVAACTSLIIAGCSESERITLDENTIIIELEGVTSLNRTGVTGGRFSTAIDVLGDINGDQCTDFVISTSGDRRRYGGDLPEGSGLQAYSGRDGILLWHIGGKSAERAKADGERGWYKIDDFTVIDDVDSDGIKDIYCRHFRNSVLLSGSDGQRICRAEVGKGSWLKKPLFCRDFDGDGTTDLFFDVSDRDAAGIQAFSGKDLSPVSERYNPWPETNLAGREWFTLRERLPRFSDIDGDGVADRLLEQGGRKKEASGHDDFAVISGADESIVKYLGTLRPRAMAIDGPHYTPVSDLNGDSVSDILMNDQVGGGDHGHSSYIMAISGSDGRLLWQILGTDTGGRPQHALVDRKGQETALPPDATFKHPVTATPDLDGDGVNDLAAIAFAPGSENPRKVVLLFSGVDGKPLKPLLLPDHIGNIWGGNLIVLEAAGIKKQPCIAIPVAGGVSREEKFRIVVVPLPKLSPSI